MTRWEHIRERAIAAAFVYLALFGAALVGGVLWSLMWVAWRWWGWHGLIAYFVIVAALVSVVVVVFQDDGGGGDEKL